MILIDAAAAYCQRHGLKTRILVVNCRRFCRYFPTVPAEEIDSALLQKFRESALRDALSTVTIEKTVTDVCTVSKSITGKTVEPGKRLRISSDFVAGTQEASRFRMSKQTRLFRR